MSNLPTPGKDMFAGIIGDLVQTYAPHTEAHPVAIALQLLVALGNAVGREPHYYVGETRHSLNEFLALVGRSGRARKGDSRHIAFRPFEEAAPDWFANVTGGLSSGEGLISAVRDPVTKIRGKGEGEGEEYVADTGVADKRLCVIETEFSSTLKVLAREGNVLSAVLRDAWDGKSPLRTLTKNSPLRATRAHISVIVHTTPEDLAEYLSSTDAANGFGNRFLFAMIDRAQLLPEPTRVNDQETAALAKQLTEIIEHGRTIETLTRTRQGSALWHEIYSCLSRDEPGLIGNLLARSEAHVARLSALYALLAQASKIDADHIESALAVWDYCAESTRRIFAGRTGNDAADRIRSELLPGQTMSLSEIREQIFAKHVSAGRLSAAINLLTSLGEVTTKTEPTGGRNRLLVTRLDPNMTDGDDQDDAAYEATQTNTSGAAGGGYAA